MSVDGDARAAARAVADAVLYEGYLLYPYRASARKNVCRWQFGVLGPERAAADGLGEDSELVTQFPVTAGESARISVTVRFLHRQRRTVRSPDGAAVAELHAAGRSWLSWDEAVEHEHDIGPIPLVHSVFPFTVPGAEESAAISDDTGGVVGTMSRTREPLRGELELSVDAVGGYRRVGIVLRNTGAAATDPDDALARSLLGAHLIAELDGGLFHSLTDPPADAEAVVESCCQQRCFPVLAGPPGQQELLLVSPIILYDHPEIAPQSQGPLFDSTEIDEILALRVLTMTDEEKREARATDPLAAEIIDRCDNLDAEQLGSLHGVLREDPSPRVLPTLADGVDWWDPMADSAVAPDTDAVAVAGVLVRKGSRVRLHPGRRADAQDLFYAGRTARVVTVHEDVDGGVHVGVVAEDDPAAELHEWYGRYLYFAPDEIEPLDGSPE
ncbi:hypothetical protein [Nocardia sp. NPDC046763]|uniref:hypothetical protein n=1 Tax=Nocardia sp. NPDC046763 TaxID=3155256 RepID=UPI0033CBD609